MKKRETWAPLAVGITGGIGSGKTEAAKIFGSLGVRLLFADRMATELINSREEIRDRIRRTFGKSVILPDGTLDRRTMAKLVFGDRGLMKKLNAIVHPSVLEAIEDEIAQFKRRGDAAVIMVEAALVYEAHAERLFDYVIVVDAPERDRIDRIVRRDHAIRAEVVQRIKAQMPPAGKAARADFVIRNTGDFRLLEMNCRFVHRILLHLSGGRECAE